MRLARQRGRDTDGKGDAEVLDAPTRAVGLEEVNEGKGRGGEDGARAPLLVAREAGRQKDKEMGIERGDGGIERWRRWREDEGEMEIDGS